MEKLDRYNIMRFMYGVYHSHRISYKDHLQAAERKQMLLPKEVRLMESLKEEAFNYAYYCKREQPTVDEAQHAYESGAYPDEIGRDKA